MCIKWKNRCSPAGNFFPGRGTQGPISATHIVTPWPRVFCLCTVPFPDHLVWCHARLPPQLLGLHWLIKLCRFQGYNSIIHHLNIILCGHHPQSCLFSLHLSPLYPRLPPPPPFPSGNHHAVVCLCGFCFGLFFLFFLLNSVYSLKCLYFLSRHLPLTYYLPSFSRRHAHGKRDLICIVHFWIYTV